MISIHLSVICDITKGQFCGSVYLSAKVLRSEASERDFLLSGSVSWRARISENICKVGFHSTRPFNVKSLTTGPRVVLVCGGFYTQHIHRSCSVVKTLATLLNIILGNIVMITK